MTPGATGRAVARAVAEIGAGCATRSQRQRHQQLPAGRDIGCDSGWSYSGGGYIDTDPRSQNLAWGGVPQARSENAFQLSGQYVQTMDSPPTSTITDRYTLTGSG